MKKIIFLLIMIVFFSGCGVNYELYYKSENEIIENVSFKIENRFINMYNTSSLKYLINNLNSYKDFYGISNYQYNLEEEEIYTHYNLNKKHSNIESVINNKLINNYFKNVNYYEVGENYVIELSGYLDYGSDVDDFRPNEDEESFLLNIAVKSNYKVKSNADKSNNFTGVYEWTFDPSDEDKTLKITFTDEINVLAWIFNRPVIYISAFVIIFSILIFAIVKLFINRNRKINEI